MATRKRRCTIVLPPELLERATDAVCALPEGSVSGLIETALEQYVRLLETLNGGPFAPRLAPLRRGRRRRLTPD
jgi:hypothetical protein